MLVLVEIGDWAGVNQRSVQRFLGYRFMERSCGSGSSGGSMLVLISGGLRRIL